MFNHFLVGGIPTPLTNMRVNWDDYSKYMESHNPVMFQTSNQLLDAFSPFPLLTLSRMVSWCKLHYVCRLFTTAAPPFYTVGSVKNFSDPLHPLAPEWSLLLTATGNVWKCHIYIHQNEVPLVIFQWKCHCASWGPPKKWSWVDL